jgi:hypothetical protein
MMKHHEGVFMSRFLSVLLLMGWALPLSSQETNKPPSIPPSIVRVIDFNSNQDITIEITQPVPVTQVGTRTVEVNGKTITESFTYTTTAPQLATDKLVRGEYALVTLTGKPVVDKEALKGSYVFYAASTEGIDKSFRKMMSPNSIILLPVTPVGTKPRMPVLPPIAGSAPAKMPEVPVASDAPPEAEIKKLLEKQMWGPPQQGGTKHMYQYQSLKIGQPRQGNFRTDGVPANSKTMVYPVKVSVTITKLYTDGSTKQEDKNQSYVFFKDEFGDWTYRFKGNE